MPDWLVAVDDEICERWQHCVWCQRRGVRVWVEVLTVGPLALTVTLCPSCYERDKTFAQVQQVLERRYAASTSRLDAGGVPDNSPSEKEDVQRLSRRRKRDRMQSVFLMDQWCYHH